MNTDRSNGEANQEPGARASALRRLIRLPIMALFMAAILFISAGRLDWAMAWVYLGFYMVSATVGMLIIVSRHPDLIDERADAPKDAKGWDKVLSSILIVLTLLVPLPVAGLDRRFGWSPQLPLALQLVALAVCALGCAPGIWAAASNKFYSRVVRVQEDREHVVVSDGPYHYVRHPGYAGAMVNLFSLPLVLGSLWALIPAGVAACLLVLRASLEDRTLQEELNGYKDYAQRVRFRLLPGIW